MTKVFAKHKHFWTQKRFIAEVFVGFSLLAASIVATFYANSYTSSRASNSVTDLLLDNLPTVNVDLLFNEGALVFVAAVALILFYEPKRIPFVLKAVALFTFVRSAFMVLTHLAPPPDASYLDTADILHKISSGEDLFFSAHTGLPFLLAIIFWQNKRLKYFFLAATVVGGATVILGHLYYSIDVLSAFFIAFGIFHLSKLFFDKDYALFLEPNPADND